MPEITREEIERRLLALDDPWLSAAFAVRVATLTLPYLTEGIEKNKSFLWYWRKTEQQQLFNILWAWHSSWINVSLKEQTDNNDVYAAAYAASVETAGYAYPYAYTATYSVCAAYSAYKDTVYQDTIYATVYAATVLSQDKIINRYLLELENKLNVINFLEQSFTSNLKQELFIQELKKLGNGFDYWADWYAARLHGEPLDEDLARKICLLPEEILAQSPAEINAYLKSLSHAASLLNRVRIIFMGFGEAGKTSIIRVLRGGQVIEGKEAMTPGIDIHELTVPNADNPHWKIPESENIANPLIAHLWDFGGQVMAHSTHKFFLRSNCLYVLVLDSRTEINGDEQAEYWLTHVRAYAGDAPVMIVGNKLDQVRINLNMSYLREKYKNIVDFYPLSCTQAHGTYQAEFKRFERDLIKELQEVGTRQVSFTQQYFTALKELRSCAVDKSFLAKKAFTNLCLKYGINQEGELNQDWFLDLLDKLGVIIHFPKIRRLDEYVLNPRWLTYGIYTLLYSKTAKQTQGKLCEDQVFKILNNILLEDNQGKTLDYPTDKCGFIIDAMEQFEVAYRLSSDRQVFIIPVLLASDTPALNFDKESCQLAFSFDFSGFLPRHLITGLIVRRHTEIESNLVWQNGVLLHSLDKQARALVQADYHDRRLSLWVQGKQASRYFTVLHDEVLQLLKDMLDLKYKQWVKLPSKDSEARASFLHLLALEQAGELSYVCEYGKFDVQELLGYIMPKEEREKHIHQTHNHITGDYIHNGDKQMGNINAKNIGIAQTGDHATANMGDQNISTSHNATPPSLDDIKTELATLQKIIAGLKLAEPQKVERALANVADELKKPEPNKEEVTEALGRVIK